MRRLIAIILLTLLPFQFTWAAVAAYCGHESDAMTQHFGHHEHQHQADADVSQVDDDTAGKTLSGSDLDCGHCHGSCSGMPAPLNGVMPLAVASHPVTPVEGIVRTLTHSPPERPQWAPLA